MVKAMDFVSEGSACMFGSRFYIYDDDGGATRSGAGEHEAQALTCRNERSECRRLFFIYSFYKTNISQPKRTVKQDYC